MTAMPWIGLGTAFETAEHQGQKQQSVQVGALGIAGQAQNHMIAKNGNQHGFAWFQPDLVKKNVGAEFFQHHGQIVLFAHAHAATGEQHAHVAKI